MKVVSTLGVTGHRRLGVGSKAIRSLAHAGLSYSNAQEESLSYAASLGDASANRYVLVITHVNTKQSAIPTLDVNGQSLGLIGRDGDGSGGRIHVFGGIVPTGDGDQTIACTWDNAAWRYKTIGAWVMRGLDSLTPSTPLQSDNNGNQISLSMDTGEYLFLASDLNGGGNDVYSDVADVSYFPHSHAVMAEWRMDTGDPSFVIDPHNQSGNRLVIGFK